MVDLVAQMHRCIAEAEGRNPTGPGPLECPGEEEEDDARNIASLEDALGEALKRFVKGGKKGVARTLKLKRPKLLGKRKRPTSAKPTTTSTPVSKVDDHDMSGKEKVKPEDADAASASVTEKGAWTYVPWKTFGHIVFKPGHCNFHCKNPAHIEAPPYKCHMDRITTPNPQKRGQGRVLALGALWLEQGAGVDRATHQDYTYKKTLGDPAFVKERRAVRDRLHAHPNYKLLAGAERKKLWDAEDSEPELVP